MSTYIANVEIHARPDVKKPTEIVRAGQPLVCDADYAADLLDAGHIRKATAAELKMLGHDGDEERAEKAAKTAAAKAEAKAAAPAVDATKAAAAAKAAETDPGAGLV